MHTNKPVHICYAGEDRRLAIALCGYLQERGIACKLAEEQASAGEARLMVVIFSWFANDSPEVIAQVEQAFNRKLPIIPFSIEDFAPAPPLQYFLSKTQWIYALNENPESFFEELHQQIAVRQPAMQIQHKGGAPLRKAVLITGLIVAGGVAIYLANTEKNKIKNTTGHVQITDSSTVAIARGDSASARANDTGNSGDQNKSVQKDTQQFKKPAARKNISGFTFSSVQEMEGATFIAGPSAEVGDLRNTLLFIGAEKNIISFSGKINRYSIRGRVRRNGNVLEFFEGDVEGKLALQNNGSRITGSLLIKKFDVNRDVDLIKN